MCLPLKDVKLLIQIDVIIEFASYKIIKRYRYCACFGKCSHRAIGETYIS